MLFVGLGAFTSNLHLFDFETTKEVHPGATAMIAEARSYLGAWVDELARLPRGRLWDLIARR